MSAREISPTPTIQSVNLMAREVFGDPKKAYSWMNTPNRLLGGTKPADFIQYGNLEDLELVMDELSRIEQGIF